MEGNFSFDEQKMAFKQDFSAHQDSALTKMFIKMGVVKDANQAKKIMLILAIVCFAASLFILFKYVL